YSTFLVGSNGDFGSAIAADASGNAYVGGVTLSGDFPVTANAFQKSFSGAFAFKSTDGGATWTRSDSGLPGAVLLIRVNRADPSIVYALSSGVLFKSIDRGASWRPTTATDIDSFWIHPKDSTLFVSSKEKIFRSRDAGATFSALSTGSSGHPNLIAFDPANPSV